jgi:hypothetical protein
MEDGMTRNILMSASFALFSGAMFALVAGTPSADASTILQQCNSGSKNRTVNCCEAALVGASLLIKDSVSGQSCSTAVRCSRQGTARLRCYVLRDEPGGGSLVRRVSRSQRK